MTEPTTTTKELRDTLLILALKNEPGKFSAVFTSAIEAARNEGLEKAAGIAEYTVLLTSNEPRTVRNIADAIRAEIKGV